VQVPRGGTLALETDGACRPTVRAIATASRDRPALEAAAGAGAPVDLSATALLPNVALVGSFFGLVTTTQDDQADSPYLLHPYGEHGYGGGLFLRWEADYQLKLPRLRRARADYRSAVAMGDVALAAIALEVTVAYETVAETRQKMNVLHEGDKYATKWLDLAKKRFEERKADAREFTDALVAYFDAHGNYLQAIFDYDSAVAWLGRTVGAEPEALK
jgi:outer membrane protein TolC